MRRSVINPKLGAPEDDSSDTVSTATFAARLWHMFFGLISLPNTLLVITLRVLQPPTGRSAAIIRLLNDVAGADERAYHYTAGVNYYRCRGF